MHVIKNIYLSKQFLCIYKKRTMETINEQNANHVVSWMDQERRSVTIDGVLYIKSWRGTKKEPKPRWNKEQRRHYMKKYRLTKKEELKRLKGFYEKHNK